LSVTVLPGDCLELIRTLADSSVDACVTDPPYALVSITKRWSGDGPPPAHPVYARASAGFMGKAWDTGDVAHSAEFWREVYRVLKPGGHVLAFAGTRTHHRLACAIEDAGFEIRDSVYWTYGSGFPKSHDVSKGIDKAAGAEREVVGSKLGQPGYSLAVGKGRSTLNSAVDGSLNNSAAECAITAPATPEAIRWAGWGTALKPAVEPICMARKPLSEGTVAANVLRWGTGAINVDGCRVEAPGADLGRNNNARTEGTSYVVQREAMRIDNSGGLGRWPANLIHDGSDEVLAAFPETGISSGGSRGAGGQHGAFSPINAQPDFKPGFGDTGSAARFFYAAKADADDRLGSRHPTVKPVDLMQYLVRLVTPKGGLVLDPFAGTGTTGEAAIREGMRAILIEREPEYLADIKRRLELVNESARSRKVESFKARGKIESAGPLFEIVQ
jgi:DNA modification methylase